MRVAAETGLKRGFDKRVTGAVVVDAEKALDAFPLAEGGEADASLALEEAALPARMRLTSSSS